MHSADSWRVTCAGARTAVEQQGCIVIVTTESVGVCPSSKNSHNCGKAFNAGQVVTHGPCVRQHNVQDLTAAGNYKCGQQISKHCSAGSTQRAFEKSVWVAAHQLHIMHQLLPSRIGQWCVGISSKLSHTLCDLCCVWHWAGATNQLLKVPYACCPGCYSSVGHGS